MPTSSTLLTVARATIELAYLMAIEPLLLLHLIVEGFAFFGGTVGIVRDLSHHWTLLTKETSDGILLLYLLLRSMLVTALTLLQRIRAHIDCDHFLLLICLRWLLLDYLMLTGRSDHDTVRWGHSQGAQLCHLAWI